MCGPENKSSPPTASLTRHLRHVLGSLGAPVIDGFGHRLVIRLLQLCEERMRPSFDAWRVCSRISCAPAGIAATSDAAASASAMADFANVPTRSMTCFGFSPHSRANRCQ